MSSLSLQKRFATRKKPAGSAPRTRAILSDVFPETVTDGAAVGFVLARIPRDSGTVLWVQDHVSAKEAGRPFMAGLMAMNPVLRLRVSRPADVLRGMEEGLRCKALGAVIGEVWGDPPALNFTATKRLAMRAETNNLPCWLIRRAASPDLSAARDRWRVASLPSGPHPNDPKAPGEARWRVELFRSRSAQPGTWVAQYDSTADRIDFSAPFRDGTVAENSEKTARRTA